MFLDQGEEPSVAGAEVEDAARVFWNELQQSGLAFGAVRDGVGALEVVAGVVGRRPEIDGRVCGHFVIPFLRWSTALPTTAPMLARSLPSPEERLRSG